MPEDVSVTGFQRPSKREGTNVDLTSVGSSYEAIGAASLKRLQYRIKNPSETSRTVLFPCEYHAGTTIGPAKSLLA